MNNSQYADLYELLHHALDTHCPDTMAHRVSVIMTGVSAMHLANTGESIGESLGWNQ